MTVCGRFDSHLNVKKRCRTRFTETVGNYISSEIIAEVKQTRMLVSNKENLLLSSTMSIIFKKNLLVSAIMGKKEPVTQSRS